MLAEDISPTEVGKHADIIKAAQEELSEMDVLVCGRCLRAFHFVDEFQTHKEDATCEKETSTVKESLESKPKIWAFTLWKATQQYTRKESAAATSWALYQNWVKLDDAMREPWIVAGKTIQSFGKIGHGELQDMPVRITKTVVNPNVTPKAGSKGKLTAAALRKDAENERPKSKPGTPIPSTNAASTTAAGAITAKPGNRIATRTDADTGKRTEETVEKIVAKRFNPRRKTHEYLVKWIDRPHMGNTWEATASLERVPYFLQVFEKQLARQKLTRERSLEAHKRQEGGTTTPTNTTTNTQAAASSPSSTTRPTRTSKTKAMDQVKQWVSESGGTGTGSTSPSSANEDESAEWTAAAEVATASTTTGVGASNQLVGGSLKRKLNNTDSSLENANISNDSMGMEDLEEDLIPSHTVKRLKNGTTTTTTPATTTSINNEVVSKGKQQLGKVNGNATIIQTSTTSTSSTATPKMAELIFTQDSSNTGVVRKTDLVSISQSLKREKPEGIVRLLTKTEKLLSSTGIVRVEQQQQQQQQKPNSPLTIGKRAATISRTTATSSPITVGTRQQLVRQPTAATTTAAQQQQQQSPGQLAVQRRVAPTRAAQQQQQQQVRVTSRVVGRPGTPQQRQQQQQQISPKQVTPEQKILQLSKSGDLKVTRKVVTGSEPSPTRLQQQRQYRQQQLSGQKTQQQQQLQRLGGLAAVSPKVELELNEQQHEQQQQHHHHQQQQQQEENELHSAQLCPITGKLIGQEESQLKMEQEQQEEQQREELEAAAQALLGGNISDQQLLTNEDGSALLVRGEDGTVYQVAGKNAEGQTILVTQGPDGEQQFAYVAAAEGDDQDVLTLDNAVAEAVAQLPANANAEQQQQQQQENASNSTTPAGTATPDGGDEQILVNMTEEELAQHQAAVLEQQQQQQQQQQQGLTDEAGNLLVTPTQIHITTSDGDGIEANIPAEVVQADLPSPGGTRRVVLLLQDGTFMMTEMHDEQFKTLNIQTEQNAADAF